MNQLFHNVLKGLKLEGWSRTEFRIEGMCISEDGEDMWTLVQDIRYRKKTPVEMKADEKA